MAETTTALIDKDYEELETLLEAQASTVLTIWEQWSEEDQARAQQLYDDGTPANTRKSYASDRRYFWAWVAIRYGLDSAALPRYPVPVPAVLRFILDHVGERVQSDDAATPASHVKPIRQMAPALDQALRQRGVKRQPGPSAPSTISRRLAALAHAHDVLGLDSPTWDTRVKVLLRKSRRARVTEGWRPRKKEALALTRLDQLLATCADDSMHAIRDTALLLFAFCAGGRRRSEVAAAQLEDLVAEGDDFLYTVPHSKTDQAGEGLTVPVSGRAAEALRRWLAAAHLSSGPIFRGMDQWEHIKDTGLSDKTVYRIVKHRAQLAGLDPAHFGAHSLRAGFVTEGGLQNLNIGDVMAMSGHRSVEVAMSYYRPAKARKNPARKLAG